MEKSNCSAVAYATNPDVISNLHEYLSMEGVSSLALLKPRGRNAVLLTFDDEALRLPLYAREDEFFRLISCLSGKLITVDHVTLKKLKFAAAHILITTSSRDFIARTCRVEINGLVFPIKITEKPWLIFPSL
ncbi:hypothetical protein SADUNF_Sadunf06G0173600 [Salix dunnii]|uniref:Uncharacterized protein n=1 Tax=Salix dunnii TaxID=1413687 RepID=A0A835K4Z7_9ROSI|nr:hypothetical protein SADUNF_Sadunf06G0173600 [Salix dunnii]